MFLNNNDSSEVNMKKIGLVGGTGPESTLMYYKELNSRIDYLTGGKIFGKHGTMFQAENTESFHHIFPKR